MENLQTVPWLLGTGTWAADAVLQFDFKGLPRTLGMAIPHALCLDFELDLDPTYTTAPTVVGHNAAIKTLSINDGQREWFPMGGGFNMLRAFERLETGRPALPDTLLGLGSTNNRYIRRRFWWNPPRLYGQPADGAYNCPFLNNGSGKIVATCGALTDISADCTAATGTLRVWAQLVRFYDKCLWPAYYTRQMNPVNSGNAITQRALYATIGLLNSTAFDAFAAGDVGNVILDAAGDPIMRQADTAALTAAHNADFGFGQIDSLNGDPRSATLDINQRQTNLTSGTALAPQALDLQPVLWPAPDVRLTKLAYTKSDMTMTLGNGNQTTQQLLGRFLPVSATERLLGKDTAKAALSGRTEVSWDLRLADDRDGVNYTGPLRDFFPLELKLASTGRAAA